MNSSKRQLMLCLLGGSPNCQRTIDAPNSITTTYLDGLWYTHEGHIFWVIYSQVPTSFLCHLSCSENLARGFCSGCVVFQWKTWSCAIRPPIQICDETNLLVRKQYAMLDGKVDTATVARFLVVIVRTLDDDLTAALQWPLYAELCDGDPHAPASHPGWSESRSGSLAPLNPSVQGAVGLLSLIHTESQPIFALQHWLIARNMRKLLSCINELSRGRGSILLAKSCGLFCVLFLQPKSMTMAAAGAIRCKHLHNGSIQWLHEARNVLLGQCNPHHTTTSPLWKIASKVK